MSNRLQQAKSFRDLLARGPDDGPYVFSSIFSNKGWRARALSKQKFKLLKRLDPAIRSMLHEGERVVFLTYGVTVSFLEAYFLGGAIQYVNRRAIVLTNERILLIQIGWLGKARALRAQISYEAIERVKVSLLGNTKLRFRDGSSKVISGVPRRDRRFLKDMISQLIREMPARQTRVAGLEDLCPHCYQPVADRPRACPECSGAFKSSARAGVLSLLFPGFGDWYIGHRWLAAAEMITTAVFWGFVVMLALDPTMVVGATLTMAAFVLIFVHGFDAAVTMWLAKRGIHPAAKRQGSGGLGLVAAAVPLGIVLAFVGVGAGGKTGMVPPPLAVPGAELSSGNLNVLRHAGYLQPQEPIVYFYSNGQASLLQDGNFFTDSRVVSYAQSGDSVFHEAAAFDDIVDLHVEFADQPDLPTTIYVVTRDERLFYLIVSPEQRRDSVFAVMLEERWRAARDHAPRNVPWYDGGSGFSANDPIAIRGSGFDVHAAETWWLARWFGTPDTDWRLLRHVHRVVGNREIAQVVMQPADGDPQTFFFDVTESSRR